MNGRGCKVRKNFFRGAREKKLGNSALKEVHTESVTSNYENDGEIITKTKILS